MSLPLATTFVQTHMSLREVLSTAKKLPDDQVGQGLAVLTHQLTAPEAQKQIEEEVKDLSVRAVTLEKAFATVDTLIGQQYAEDLTIDALTKTCQALHQDYKQLLAKSSEVAGQAHDVADSFASKFMQSLSDPKVSAAEKAAAIQNYNKLVDQNSKTAHDLSDGFAKLQKGVSDLLQTWPCWDSEDITLRNTDNEIQALQNTVIDLLNNVSNLQLTYTYGGIPPTTGITSILGSIIPSFWTTALATAVGSHLDPTLLASIKSEALALKPELAAKKAVRAEVEAALTPRQQLQAYLIDIPVDLDGVVKPLSALTTIWDSIRSDLTVIQQTMSSSDVQAQQLLLPRLAAFAGLYKLVARSFAGYKMIVTASLANSA